uniref:MerR family DNA-binding protein n=1 Tax=Agathobacter sp. TaxID=2021311 RepID=UPI004055F28F
MIKLHQILALKSLGFSLERIKDNFISPDTPVDVANAFADQADAVKRQIESLSETLSEIVALREEVLQIQISVPISSYIHGFSPKNNLEIRDNSG